MLKYEPGDKVRVKKISTDDSLHGCGVVSDMIQYIGNILTIERESDKDIYTVKENKWQWATTWVEPIQKRWENILK